MDAISLDPLQHKYVVQYLPLVGCSPEDAIYPVDDGELDLLSFELVVDVLQKKVRHGQLMQHHLKVNCCVCSEGHNQTCLPSK